MTPALLLRRAFGALAFLIGLALIAWFLYNQFWPTEAFRSAYRGIWQLGVPVACLWVGWSWMRHQGKGIEQVTPPDLKCPELDRAAETARATLPAFIAEVEKGIDGAFIKFPLHTPGGLLEHIWAYVHFHREGQFNVTLANDPIDRQQSADGRRNVPATEVEDWQIMHPDGTIRGAYSVIALFQHYEQSGRKLSPRMRQQKAQLLSAGEAAG